MPNFGINETSQGMIEPGNIDLHKRPIHKNADGSISTVLSMSIGTDQGEVLIPMISDSGESLDAKGAVDLYRRTGKHLGIFDGADSADAYAESLHEAQAKEYLPKDGQAGVTRTGPHVPPTAPPSLSPDSSLSTTAVAPEQPPSSILPPIWRQDGVWDAYNAQRRELPASLRLDEPAAADLDTSWLDKSAAMLRQSGNVVTAGYDYVAGAHPDVQDGYDPFTDDIEFIKANPDAIKDVINSRSSGETRLIIDRKRQDQKDIETLANTNGIVSFAGTMAAALADPTTIASLAIPVTAEVGLGRIGRIAAGTLAQGAVVAGQEALTSDLHPDRTLAQESLSVGGAMILTAGFGVWATRVPKAAFNAAVDQVDKEFVPVKEFLNTVPADKWGRAPEQLDLLGNVPTAQVTGSLAARREAADSPELLLSQQRATTTRLEQLRARTANAKIPDPIQPPTPQELAKLTTRKTELEAAQGDILRGYGLAEGTDLSKPVRAGTGGARSAEREANLLAAQSEFSKTTSELTDINAKLQPVVDKSPEALLGREQAISLELEQAAKGFDIPKGQTLSQHVENVRARQGFDRGVAEDQARVEANMKIIDNLNAELVDVRKTLAHYEGVAGARAEQQSLEAHLEHIERQLADRPVQIAGGNKQAEELLRQEQAVRAAIRELPKKYGVREDVPLAQQERDLPLSKNKTQAEAQMSLLAARGEEKILRQNLAEINQKLSDSGHKGAAPVTEEELIQARAGIQQDLFSMSEAPFPESIWKRPAEIPTEESPGPAVQLIENTPPSAVAPSIAPELGQDSASAARVAGQSLKDTQIASGGGIVAKTMGKVSPALRVLTRSSVPKANELATKLVEIAAVSNGEMRGLASAPSLQRVVNNLTDKALKETNAILDAEYLAYRKAGGKLSLRQVGEQAIEAMHKKDTHALDAAQKIARKTRPIFNDMLEQLKQLGILHEDFEFKGANGSFAPYVYNHQKIVDSRTGWDTALFNFFKRNPKLDENGLALHLENAEIMDAVAQTTKNVLGTLRGVADNGAVRAARSTKQRTLDVPYDIIKDYLVNDYETVMKGYFRTVVPMIENKKMFEEGFDAEIQSLTDDYAIQIQRAGSDKIKAKLHDEMVANIEDLRGLHKRAMLQAGPTGDQNSAWVTAAKTVRTWGFIRDLGQMTLSAAVDLPRVMMQHGMTKTFTALGKYLGSPEFKRVTRGDAQRMNTALDWILHTRGPSLADVGDSMEGTTTQKVLGSTARTFSRLSLMASWNDMMKSVVTVLEQDALVRAAANPDALTAYQRGSFANIGFGTDELQRFKGQIDKYAVKEQGVWRLRTDLWDDKGLGKRFELGLGKRADILVQTQGAADLPFLMDGNLGKTIFQFQSFGFGAVNRLMIPAAQGLRAGDAKTAMGVVAMVGMGGLVYALREKIAGREADLSLKRLALEGVNRSGVIGYIPTYSDPLNDLLHLDDNFGIPKFSQYGEARGPSDLLGPTQRTADTIWTGISRATKDEVPTGKATLETIFKLLPFRTLPGMQRVLHATEGELAEAMNMEGADHTTFGKRLLESKPLEQK